MLRYPRYQPKSRATVKAAQSSAKRQRSFISRRRPSIRKPPAGELKVLQAAQALAADTTGAILLLNGIARGDDYNTREGRQIWMHHMELRIQFSVTGATGIDQTQRCLLVLDTQPNGVALTVANVLESASTLAYPTLEYRNRFKILMDHAISLNASAEAGSHTFMKRYFKLLYPVTFNAGNAGTIADIATNSLYFISLGSSAPGVTAGAITVASRIRFEDK